MIEKSTEASRILKMTHFNQPIIAFIRHLRDWRWFGCALLSLFFIGCRQRAYTEFYVENMASEVRMLEDRVYDYDSAYQSLEQEVEQLKQTNSRLQEELRLGKLNFNELESGARKPLPHKLKDPLESRLTPKKPAPNSIKEPPSVLIPNSDSETMELPPPVIRTPAPPPNLKDKESEPILAPPQSSDSRKRNPHLPDVDGLTEQVSLPATMVRSAQPSKLLVAPPDTTPRSIEPLPKQKDGNAPSLLKALPNIREGDPQSWNRKRIQLPEGSTVQLASATEAIPLSKNRDDKVFEVAFHPTLCRGHNFDEKAGDDGLYLVVTPVNESGQVVNSLGTLTIVVEDSAIPEKNGRVAAWEFRPEQLKELNVPIGAAQGFHLSLPWQDTSPISQSVAVFLLFQTEDGRQWVSRRDIQLRKPTAGQSTWTPLKTSTHK